MGKSLLYQRKCRGCDGIDMVRFSALGLLCKKCAARESHRKKEWVAKQSNSHKGQISGNKGKRATLETKLKQSLAKKGKAYPLVYKFPKGLIPHNKKQLDDKVIIESYLNGISSIQLAKDHNVSKPTILKRLRSGLGKVRQSNESLVLYYKNRPKELHPQWRGGITSINNTQRNNSQYYHWRKAVLKRDSNLCVICGSDDRIVADHIKPFALFKELRYDLDNGRALCHDCHSKTPSYKRNIKTLKTIYG